jgi:hypothetical protein
MLLQYLSTGDVESFEARVDLDLDTRHPVDFGKGIITEQEGLL